ncbi:MAG TPA: hypothetical protein VKR06_19110 [Ktedonosporobacter sp.]|nr:hypothetical protein [Ktedonosporobacter sp.]
MQNQPTQPGQPYFQQAPYFSPGPPPAATPRRWPWIVALVLVFFLGFGTGLASSNVLHISSSSTGGLPFVHTIDGYMNADNQGVRYLKWTESNGQLSGQWSSATIDSFSTKINYLNGALTGIHNGTSISLTLKLTVLEVAATGTLDNGTLTLQMPGVNGKTQQTVFQGVSQAEYDKALADFKAKYS